LKQKVWVVSHYGVTFYRRGLLGDARWRFQLCLKVARDYLPDDADGTRARIYYLLGLLDRETHDHKTALRNFTESMNYAWKTLARQHDQQDGSPLNERVRFQATLRDVNLARCLGLGLAW